MRKPQKRMTRTRGPRWISKWRDPSGKDHSMSFPSEAQAAAHTTAMVAAKNAGSYRDPTVGRVTLGVYAAGWRKDQLHHAPSTAANYGGLIRNHIVPLLGDRPLQSLDRPVVQSWVKALEGRLGPSSIEQVYGLLATILRAAVLDGKLASSPCVKIHLPKVPHTPVVPMTLAQVLAISEAVPSRYRALVLVAAETGMRFGELAGLTVDRVRFLPRPQIRVDRQWTRYSVLGTDSPTKTPASKRNIPLGEATAARLSVHLAEFPALEPGRFVFHHGRRPLAGNTFNKTWHQALVQAQMGRDDVTVHDLRHFHASWLIHRGWTIVQVAARLGHKSIKETQDTYAHLFPQAEDEERRALDGLAIAV